MGKCDFIITKGRNKGNNHGSYTQLKGLDNKFYCRVHHNMIEPPKNKNIEIQ